MKQLFYKHTSINHNHHIATKLSTTKKSMSLTLMTKMKSMSLNLMTKI